MVAAAVNDIECLGRLLAERHDAEVELAGVERHVGPGEAADLQDRGRLKLVAAEADLDGDGLGTIPAAAIHLDVDEAGFARFQFLGVTDDPRAAARWSWIAQNL